MIKKLKSKLEAIESPTSMFFETEQSGCHYTNKLSGDSAKDADKYEMVSGESIPVRTSRLLKWSVWSHFAFNVVGLLFAVSSVFRRSSQLAMGRISYWINFLFASFTLVYLWYAINTIYNEELTASPLLTSLVLSVIVLVVEFVFITRFLFISVPAFTKSESNLVFDNHLIIFW